MSCRMSLLYEACLVCRLCAGKPNKLFAAAPVISGVSALSLLRGTSCDEILLIVASQLIVSVPSCLAWDGAAGGGEAELGLTLTVTLKLWMYAGRCPGNSNPPSSDKRAVSFTCVCFLCPQHRGCRLTSAAPSVCAASAVSGLQSLITTLEHEHLKPFPHGGGPSCNVGWELVQLNTEQDYYVGCRCQWIMSVGIIIYGNNDYSVNNLMHWSCYLGGIRLLLALNSALCDFLWPLGGAVGDFRASLPSGFKPATPASLFIGSERALQYLTWCLAQTENKQ